MEPIEAAHTAVVVVDFQNDLCHPQGAVASSQDSGLMEGVVAPQIRVLEAAVGAGLLVVFIRMTILPGHVDDSPARFHSKLRTLPDYGIPTQDYIIEGTWGHDVMDELKQLAPNAVHVFKSRNSAFVNTNLDLILRSNGVNTLLVTGMATDGCVAATSRGAEDHGYRCVVLRDCVASFKPELHEHALKVLASRMEVVESADVLSLLTSSETVISRRRAGAETSRGATGS